MDTDKAKALKTVCKYFDYMLRHAAYEWDELTPAERKIFRTKRAFTDAKNIAFWILEEDEGVKWNLVSELAGDPS